MSDDTRRLPVTLPGDVHQALKRAAFEQDTSMAAIAVRAIRKELGIADGKEEGL